MRQYALDYSIERDSDRCIAVQQILDTMPVDPSATDLEQMASYILYGKDENGQNAIQRNECTDKNKKFKSYKTKDDKVQSLDEMMETPGFDERLLKSAYSRNLYTSPKPTIQRPRYNHNGELIDPGDSEIPGMREQWEIIDRWQRILDVSMHRVKPTESDTIITDPYKIYLLKHNLIDIRKHQYYLKDSAKPTLHFQNLDHPKAQFYDWSGDAYYWIPYAEWERRVKTAYTSRISKRLEDYETRGEGDQLEVKWIVCVHTFDWEDPAHVRALFNQYNQLYENLRDKLDTYGRTLLWDFDRYVSLCDFSELRLLLIDMRKKGYSYDEILEEIRKRYNVDYSPNYIVSVGSQEIPRRIARIAKLTRLDYTTPPENRKTCIHCGRLLPKDPAFFSRNNSHRDHLSNTCKQCDRRHRIERGVISNGDLRAKDPTLPKMQT